MGLGKWQHIEALGKLPEVDALWNAKFGRSMSSEDIDKIYAAFMPLQIAKVVDFAAPIAGVVDTIATLRSQNIKIGSCSGYPRAVMEKLVPAAKVFELGDGQLSWERRYGSFEQLSLQVTRYFRRWSIYLGGENLTNFKQKNPIIDAANPWGNNFDSTMIWGPVHGAKGYIGIRFNLARNSE